MSKNSNQDMTFCWAKCINVACQRHRSHIDWEQPKYKTHGACTNDFSVCCEKYETNMNI